ncbi:hypothetical protein T06_8926 [Trichinella sp. T6]|nr:hypothetical protein T06_8926 [Trichinella sp. T6]
MNLNLYLPNVHYMEQNFKSTQHYQQTIVFIYILHMNSWMIARNYMTHSPFGSTQRQVIGH